MKKSILFFVLIFFGLIGFAQKVIDPKYKNPSLGNKNSGTVVSLNLDKNLLVKIYGESQSDRIYNKCQAEFNSFNQKGDEIWIYADEFFGGEKKVLKAGDYMLVASAKSKELGTNWNDKISSMLIPLSLKIELFMDDKFQGAKTEAYGYGNYDRENNSKGFTGDYYVFKDSDKHTKGGIYFVSGADRFDANDNISSLKISINPNYKP